MRTHMLFAGLVLAPFAVCQDPQTITPFGSAGVLGNSNNNIPFSWSPTGYQQVHDRESFSNRNAQVFTKMRMRMASGFTNFAGQTVDLELFHGLSPVNATSASGTFASNVIPQSETNTLVRKMVSLPTVPTNDWNINFVFDVPYVWPGVTHFEWRANNYGNSVNNAIFTYPLDAWTGTVMPGVSIQNGGTAGCKSLLGTVAASLTGSVTTSALTFTGNTGVNNVLPTALVFGGSNTNSGAISLPFNLGVIGAPGCFLVNDVVVTLSTTSSASGVSTWSIPAPAPGLVDRQIVYTQMAVLQTGSNALGVFTSNGLTNIIGGTCGVSRIYAIGSPGGTAGTLGTNYGMAVGFN